MKKNQLIPVLALALAAVVPGCKGDKKSDQSEKQPTVVEPEKPTKPAVTTPAKPASDEFPPPKGLEKAVLTAHAHNPTTAEKIALGEFLFFDTRLSDEGKFACVTCHLPEKGWTDGKKLSEKADGKLNKRHSPTLYNVGYAREWYWDGRKATLEDQILAAWTGQVGGTPDKIAAALAEIPAYKEQFAKTFGGAAPSQDNIVQALGAFVRIKLRTGDAPWDRYQAGDKSAVSEDAVKGYEVFSKKAGCIACHVPPLYTDMGYHNIGVGYEGVESPDVGRFKVSNQEIHTGAFKTPGLRGLTLTAPYFHDGSAETLEAAVDFMIGGGYREGNKHIDPALKPATLTAEERAQLLAFLKSLSKDETATAPKLP